MMDRKLVFAPAFVLALVVLIALAVPASTAVSVGDKAPGFHLGNITGDGNVQLDSLTSKPTLVVFWASWCPHCRREVPVINKVYGDLHSKGMNAVGISLDDNVGDARGFVKQNSLRFPNVYGGTDEGIKVAKQYGVRGIPSVYILGKGGVVKAYYAGEVEETIIRSEFANLGVK